MALCVRLSRSAAAHASVWQLQSMLSVSWQFNNWGWAYCVMIPKRFKYRLHGECDQVLQRGKLVQSLLHHALYASNLTSHNQFCVPCWQLATPILYFGACKRRFSLHTFLLLLQMQQITLYSLQFFCKEKYNIAFSVLIFIFRLSRMCDKTNVSQCF